MMIVKVFQYKQEYRLGFLKLKSKAKNKDTSHWDLCGTGVKEINRGKYQFDIAIKEDSSSYLLYWKQHE